MATVNKTLSSFNAGELSPRVWRRLDFSKRKHGVKLLENFIPLVQGGVTRRAGTKFVASTKFNNKNTRLVPFEFSTSISYVLEVGDKYIRVFKNGGRLELTSHGSAVANGNFASDLGNWTTTGDVIWIDPNNIPPEGGDPLPPPPGGGDPPPGE